MAKRKDELVPYDQISPGFEAVYTGEVSSTPVRENEMISTLYSDEDGNLMQACKDKGVTVDEWIDSVPGNGS